MRKINTNDFRIATRTTSRDINRRIALNLIREHQPISRADLARRMNIGRGVVSVLVGELIAEGLIDETGTGEGARGRRPTFLCVRTEDRTVIAVDIRLSQTYIVLTDFGGRQIALESVATLLDPDKLMKELGLRILRLLETHKAASMCKGIGIAVPGIVDRETGRIVNAPTLNWRNVTLRDPLSAVIGLPVNIENAARACALAQMWLGATGNPAPASFLYVSVSDGVGVGVVLNGELMRGHDDMAGEFGHAPLNIDGPPCMCGANGCWEAYTSNLATLSRYFGRDLFKIDPRSLLETGWNGFKVEDVIARARAGDSKAMGAIQATARYLGLGLATLINGLNPECVYIGGEITTGWDMLEKTVRTALAQRALTEAANKTQIRVAEPVGHQRLRGAAALVTAPTFAAPRVA